MIDDEEPLVPGGEGAVVVADRLRNSEESDIDERSLAPGGPARTREVSLDKRDLLADERYLSRKASLAPGENCLAPREGSVVLDERPASEVCVVTDERSASAGEDFTSEGARRDPAGAEPWSSGVVPGSECVERISGDSDSVSEDVEPISSRAICEVSRRSSPSGSVASTLQSDKLINRSVLSELS